ncbi:hypothetical protein GGS21DRAFT_346178 [Xylaria nigripes]|nr:hypothetical protein GGS21DRAFT_346178 [Xylaria nigripes]
MSSVRSLTFLQVRRPTSHAVQSSYLTSRNLSQPPHLHYVQHGRRAFHWQSAASLAIEGTQQLIVNMHTVTNLPWFLTIPLVAFTVGAIFRLPFTIYTQRIMQCQAQLGPITQAWNTRIQEDVRRDKIPPSRFMSEVKARQDKVLARIYRKLGLQGWKLYASVLSFPFWLIAIDGVRRLCGGPRGLLGSLVARAVGSTEATEPAPAGSVVEASIVDPAISSTTIDITWNTIVDPNLRFEGCLWFTDLTISDPYHILPFALSASLVFNLLPKTKQQLFDRIQIAMGRKPQSIQAQTLSQDDRVGIGERARSIFQLTLLSLAFAIGPATLDLPAALHLYWLASSGSNALFVKILNRLMPVKPTLRKRCTGVETPVIRPQRDKKVQIDLV